MKCKRMLRGHSGSGEVRGGKTRHGPGGKDALSLAIACLMLLGLCGCQESGQAEAVLTDLTVEYEDPEFRSIVFDNAVEMMAQRNGLDSKIGTQKLEILQDAVQILETGEAEVEESGGSVAYYEMVTPFTVPEVEGFQGRISMVVAVADGEASESHGSRYIKLAEAPAVEAVIQPEDGPAWDFIAASAVVEADGSAATVLATGYFKMPRTDGMTKDSDTLSLEFTFSADMIEGL